MPLSCKDNYALIPRATVAGLIADFLLWRLQPSMERPEVLRLFAFSVPVIFFLCYFIPIILSIGITWKIHLWLGSCVMAGLIGLGLSYLLIPPQGPITETAYRKNQQDVERERH